jgi:hypothetical protein
MRGAIAALLACGVFVAANCGDAAAAGFKPVFKVDSAAVTLHNGQMTVIATGAVSTGGWGKARLRERRGHTPETNTLEFDFEALPPPESQIVIQALVPVSATVKTRLPPYGVTQIRVNTQTNSTTAPIGR